MAHIDDILKSHMINNIVQLETQYITYRKLLQQIVNEAEDHPSKTEFVVLPRGLLHDIERKTGIFPQ